MNASWIIISLAVGAVLGGFYFEGLWFTLQRLATAQQPALLLFASFTVRAAVVLLGFYFVMNGRWERLVACLAGFLLARMSLVRHLREVGEASVSLDQAKGRVA